MHLLLTPDREHGKIFANVSLIGFTRGKSLKDNLVRAFFMQLMMTLKFSRNGNVTRALTGRRPMRPAADDDF